MTPRVRDRLLGFLAVLALTIGAVGVLGAAFGNPAIGIDDANIFFVYARNLVQGHGLVYSVGGERVEGYSSPLWLAVCAAARAILVTPEPLLLVVLILLTALSVTALMGALGGLTRPAGAAAGGAERTELRNSWVWLWVGWVFSAPAYTLWCTLTLMDTGLWAAVLVAAVLTTERAIVAPPTPQRQAVLALVWALAILARPEAPAWACLLGVTGSLLAWRRARSVSAVMRVAVPMLLGAGITLAALTVFRLAYFGYPLPNTYYAKISPDRLYNLSRGIPYGGDFIVSNPFIGVAAVLALARCVAFIGGLRRPAPNPAPREDALMVLSAVAVLTGILIPVLVGGDHFGAFRFYQPIWPFLGLSLTLEIRALRRPFATGRPVPPRTTAAAVVLAVVAFIVAGAPRWGRWEHLDMAHEFDIPEVGRTKGLYLNHFSSGMPLPSVGAITAGGIQYTYAGRIVDLMGLNNLAMAHHPGKREGVKNHAAFARDVFLDQKPDLVRPFLTRAWPLTNPYPYDHFGNRTLGRIFFDPDVQAAYAVIAARRRSIPDAPFLLCLARHTYIRLLRDNPDVELHLLPY